MASGEVSNLMRKPRVLVDGAHYHVTARTNRKEMLLEPAAMKELFLGVVVRAKQKYSFRLENFSIMGNHFHFIIQPASKEKLSSILQWIMSVFAMAWNRIHDQTGHVWGQRFFSKVIAGIAEFLHTFLYIDENPVVGGLVSRGEDWAYCGLVVRRARASNFLDNPPEELCGLLPRHFPTKASQ